MGIKVKTTRVCAGYYTYTAPDGGEFEIFIGEGWTGEQWTWTKDGGRIHDVFWSKWQAIEALEHYLNNPEEYI